MSAVVNHREARPAPPGRPVQMPPMGSTMFSEPVWEEIARSLKLSGRELQIVMGVFDDETDFGIAQHIGISLHTVHTHVERLHQKLVIRNRPQLLLRVMQEFMTLIVSPKEPPPTRFREPRVTRLSTPRVTAKPDRSGVSPAVGSPTDFLENMSPCKKGVAQPSNPVPDSKGVKSVADRFRGGRCDQSPAWNPKRTA